MAPRSSTENELLKKLAQITETNLSDERFGVSELAWEIGMSRSNLHRRIKLITGLSVSQFIREIRLKRAFELLKETSLTISEVAFQVGFGSATYFSKCFHEYYGYPPGEVGENSSDKPLSQKPGQKKRFKFIPRLNKQMAVILILGLVVLITTGTYIGYRLYHNKKVQSALTNTLPALQNEFDEMITAGDNNLWGIYHKAKRLTKLLGDNLEYNRFWNNLTVSLTLTSEPAMAKVYAKPYSRPDTTWHYLGETPLQGISFPREYSRIKLEKQGFEAHHDILIYLWQSVRCDTMHYQLFRPDEKPDEMVHVPGFKGNYRNTPGLRGIEAGDFWVDKYEVTNKQYKSFVDAGGYVDPTYWQNPFVAGDDTLDWEAALGQFKDITGWSGPANWEMGNFPEGEAELPVTCISWYEASAYAAFAKKKLPTYFHWIYLSRTHAAPGIVKSGNFNGRGPAEAGVYNSMTRHGTYDLPGNVSEWILNSAGNRRFIIGGNWQEPAYQYSFRLPVSPMIRSELIGFRCMRYINDTLQQKLSRTFEWIDRDFDSAVPVSDKEFSIIEDLFKYEKGNLNPRVLSRTEEAEWVREIISVDVPYDEDLPMKMLIFFPRHFKAPYQSLIYFPGGDARSSYSMEDMKVDWQLDFLLKSGRAVIWPVYYATYGRGEIINRNDIHTQRQALIYRVIDFQLACDYINTRSEFDREKIAYYGISWGGRMAPINLSIEDRVKLGILCLFGVQSSGEYREFDEINYLPRVKIPMLLMDGRYDFDFTMDQQQAFYDFLGTPDSLKEWKLYETTHYITRRDLANESLNWLDQYFGPVNK